MLIRDFGRWFFALTPPEAQALKLRRWARKQRSAIGRTLKKKTSRVPFCVGSSIFFPLLVSATQSQHFFFPSHVLLVAYIREEVRIGVGTLMAEQRRGEDPPKPTPQRTHRFRFTIERRGVFSVALDTETALKFYCFVLILYLRGCLRPCLFPVYVYEWSVALVIEIYRRVRRDLYSAARDNETALRLPYSPYNLSSRGWLRSCLFPVYLYE